jgi:hypothetical protein
MSSIVRTVKNERWDCVSDCSVRDETYEVLHTHAATAEQDDRPAAESLDALHEDGVFALRTPRDRGGAWAGAEALAGCLAGIARSCPSTACEAVRRRGSARLHHRPPPGRPGRSRTADRPRRHRRPGRRRRPGRPGPPVRHRQAGEGQPRRSVGQRRHGRARPAPRDHRGPLRRRVLAQRRGTLFTVQKALPLFNDGGSILSSSPPTTPATSTARNSSPTAAPPPSKPNNAQPRQDIS